MTVSFSVEYASNMAARDGNCSSLHLMYMA